MIRMEKEKIYKPWVFISAVLLVIGFVLALEKESFLQIVGLLIVLMVTVILILYGYIKWEIKRGINKSFLYK